MWGMIAMAGMSMISSASSNAQAGEQAEVAAYNEEYERQSNMYAAQESQAAAQRNIAAIEQDKILSDASIGMQQSQAEAQAKVSAAAAGATGSSVNDVIQQTEFTEQQARSANVAKAEQQVESELANIGSSQKAILSNDTTEDASQYVNEDAGLQALLGAGTAASSAMTGEDWDSFDSLWGA